MTLNRGGGSHRETIPFHDAFHTNSVLREHFTKSLGNAFGLPSESVSACIVPQSEWRQHMNDLTNMKTMHTANSVGVRARESPSHPKSTTRV